MSDYTSFAVAAFGPVLAEVAHEEGQDHVNADLRERAIAGWNLTPMTLRAVITEANRLLRASEGKA